MSMLFKRIKDWAVSITSFRTGDVIAVDGPNGTAKMSKDDLLKESAQNALAGNLAPAFDSNKPNDTTGYAYHRNEIVSFDGAVYRFVLDKPTGAWNSSYVKAFPLSDAVQQNFLSGGVGNPSNVYKVRTLGLALSETLSLIRIVTDKPKSEGHKYRFGYILSDDAAAVGNDLKLNGAYNVIYVTTSTITDYDHIIDLSAYPGAKAIAIELEELDENGDPIRHRAGDMCGYSLNYIYVQKDDSVLLKYFNEVPDGGTISFMTSRKDASLRVAYAYMPENNVLKLTGEAFVTYRNSSVLTLCAINYVQYPPCYDCPLRLRTDGIRVVLENVSGKTLQIVGFSCDAPWSYPNSDYSKPTGWSESDASEVGAKQPVLPMYYNRAARIINGGVGNTANVYKVRTTGLLLNSQSRVIVSIDRPPRAGGYYTIGYALFSDSSLVGKSISISSAGYIMHSINRLNPSEPIDISDYPEARVIAFEISEFAQDGTPVANREPDFYGYSISVLPFSKKKDEAVTDVSLDYSLLNSIARINQQSNGSKDFCALMVTDSHGDDSSVSRTAEHAKKSDAVSIAIHCGDFVSSYIYYNRPSTEWSNIVSRSSKPFYFTQGNHEKGTFFNVRMTPTDDTLYNLFVKPLVDKGWLGVGEYEVGKCYYYHDFPDTKVRLIVLDEYRAPTDYLETYWQAIEYDSSIQNIVDNTNYSVGDKVNMADFSPNSFQAVQSVNSGSATSGYQPCYKCRRGFRYIDKTEADWFLDVLYSTPSDYTVFVSMHNPFSDLAVPDKTKKFCQHYAVGDGVTGGQWGQNFMATDFIADALDAYKTGRSYSSVVSTKSDSEAAYIADYSVSKDFSVRGPGKFGAIIGGHVHKDVVWKHPTYTYMYQVSAMCSITYSQPNNVSADIRLQSDVNHTEYIDSLTAVAINSERIALAKLGCKSTVDARIRDIEVIS